jgi:TPR repeat protein
VRAEGFAARWRVGPDKDAVKAAELYERAAGLGDPEAMVHLANAHMRGEGVAQDVRRAFQLYCAAGLLGDETALVHILNLHQFSVDQSGTPHRTHQDRDGTLTGTTMQASASTCWWTMRI